MNENTGNYEFPPWLGESTTQSTFTMERRKVEVKVLRDHLTTDTDTQKIEEKLAEYLNNGWTITHQSTVGYAAYATTLVTILQRYSDWDKFYNPYAFTQTVFKNHEV
jgi:hypothetical protein